MADSLKPTANGEGGNSPSTGEPFLIYRGERLLIPENIDCSVEIETSGKHKAIFKVRDVSAFGVRIYSHHRATILRLNEIIKITMSFYGQVVFESTASVANESVADDQISYGLVLLSSFIDMENIRAVISNSSYRSNLRISSGLLPLLEGVRPEFKALVADLNSIFREIQNRLEAESQRISETALNDTHKNRMVEDALALSVSLNIQTILELFAQFQKVVDTLSPEENSLHKKYFRLNFGDLIRRTPFLRRAFEKPLGYPGDYGLMVMFYNYQDLGENIFDKFMHRLSCNQPIAVANQNRVEFLADLIESNLNNLETRSFKISSIACGPAHEIHLFLDRTPSNIKQKIDVVLVDHESKALDYAMIDLKKLGNRFSDFHLITIKEDAVLGILKQKAFVSQLENSNVIICAGLFDYLSDRVAGKLIEHLMEKLAPGGCLLIGNVSTEHPNRFSMEYFMEWNLMLRSPVQLMSLVPERWRNQNGFSATVISESLGINLFLEVRRNN